MTLYCHAIDQLPVTFMRGLGPGSRFSHFVEQDPATAGETERFSYTWRDFQIDLFVTRRPEIASNIDSLIHHAQSLARANRHALDPDFVKRIRSARLVIGYVAGPDFEEPTRFDRLESLLLELAAASQSVLLWESRIYDENGELLLG